MVQIRSQKPIGVLMSNLLISLLEEKMGSIIFSES